jgi:hypothetical protein
MKKSLCGISQNTDAEILVIKNAILFISFENQIVNLSEMSRITFFSQQNFFVRKRNIFLLVLFSLQKSEE